MSKKHVKENASSAGSSAGAIAATPGALGSKPGKKGKKKQDSIFAVIENIVSMGGERTNPDEMTPQQLTVLKNSMARIERIDPESPTYGKIVKMLDNASDTLLKQLAGAQINFISMLARNRVMRRGLDEEIAIIRRRAGMSEQQRHGSSGIEYEDTKKIMTRALSSAAKFYAQGNSYEELKVNMVRDGVPQHHADALVRALENMMYGKTA